MQFSNFMDAFNEENPWRGNILTGQYPNSEIRRQIINLELQMNTEEQ